MNSAAIKGSQTLWGMIAGLVVAGVMVLLLDGATN